MLEKNESFNKSFEEEKELEPSKKEKFIDAINKVILGKLKESPFILIEVFHHCSVCGKHIDDKSTDYFLSPEGVPFCSFDCFVKEPHRLGCTCELCGKNSEAEIDALFEQFLIESRKTQGITGAPYALSEARELFFKKKREEFLKRYKKNRK